MHVFCLMCLVDMVFRTLAHTLCVVCLQIYLAWSTFECVLIPWRTNVLPSRHKIAYSSANPCLSAQTRSLSHHRHCQRLGSKDVHILLVYRKCTQIGKNQAKNRCIVHPLNFMLRLAMLSFSSMHTEMNVVQSKWKIVF